MQAHRASLSPSQPVAHSLELATLSDVLAALPQAVFALRGVEPYDVLWCNDAAALMMAAEGGGASRFAAEGTVLAQAVVSSLQTERTLTIHDHVVGGQRCHTVTLTPLAGTGLCIIVAVTESAVTAQARNDTPGTLRAAGLMARMLAHEIKNPLAGIQAAGQLLAKAARDEAQGDLAQLVVRETARIGRLLERVAIFDSEGGMAPPGRVNLHAPLEHALAATATAFPQVRITRSFDPSLPDICGDHDALVQAFDNLFRNAAEAGATSLTVRSFYNHATAPVDSRQQRRLPITVVIEDNGAGMDDQTRACLFEPYYTTKAQGQGLGLPIVAKIVDNHAGLIDVASRQGQSVFSLFFPHERTPATQEGKQA